MGKRQAHTILSFLPLDTHQTAKMQELTMPRVRQPLSALTPWVVGEHTHTRSLSNAAPLSTPNSNVYVPAPTNKQGGSGSICKYPCPAESIDYGIFTHQGLDSKENNKATRGQTDTSHKHKAK